MGSAVGLYAFFMPVEFAFAMIIGVIVSYTLMKRAQFKFGRWTMMFASVANPFIVLIVNQILDIPLFWHISIGGHSNGVVIGAFLLLIELVLLNLYELRHWLRDPKDKVNPERNA